MRDPRIEAAMRGELTELMAQEKRTAQDAVREGLEVTATFTQQRFRDQITGSGLGRRLAQSVRKAVYPKKGTKTLSPAAVVRSKAPKIVGAFAEGVTIRSKNGFWLAIPSEAMPKRGTDGKRLNPSNFPEERFGRLRFVFRGRGRAGLLVLDNAGLTKAGRVRSQAGRSKRAAGPYVRTTGRTTVVAFYLVPRVTLPQKLNLATIERQAGDMLPREIVKAYEALERRGGR